MRTNTNTKAAVRVGVNGTLIGGFISVLAMYLWTEFVRPIDSAETAAAIGAAIAGLINAIDRRWFGARALLPFLVVLPLMGCTAAVDRYTDRIATIGANEVIAHCQKPRQERLAKRAYIASKLNEAGCLNCKIIVNCGDEADGPPTPLSPLVVQ
ncbi:MAG: hypothetical protein QNJ94_18605 [Alphaproteobacteria bacterium]|nr:hypothetical protein [Alphaproteobacteria bacterium]